MTDILQVWQNSFQTLLNPTGNNSIRETQNEINDKDGSYLDEHISLQDLVRLMRSPNSSTADSRNRTNYHGIALVPVTYNIYCYILRSYILNNRLQF